MDRPDATPVGEAQGQSGNAWKPDYARDQQDGRTDRQPRPAPSSKRSRPRGKGREAAHPLMRRFASNGLNLMHLAGALSIGDQLGLVGVRDLLRRKSPSEELLEVLLLETLSVVGWDLRVPLENGTNLASLGKYLGIQGTDYLVEFARRDVGTDWEPA